MTSNCGTFGNLSQKYSTHLANRYLELALANGTASTQKLWLTWICCHTGRWLLVCKVLVYGTKPEEMWLNL